MPGYLLSNYYITAIDNTPIIRSSQTDIEFTPIKLNGITINEPINNKAINGNVMHIAAINTIFKITDIRMIGDNYVKILSSMPGIHKVVDKAFFDKFQPTVGGYYVSYINQYISYVPSIIFDNTVFRNY